MKDYGSIRNNYIRLSELEQGDYDGLISKLLTLKEGEDERRVA
jgi:hypothetical protein